MIPIIKVDVSEIQDEFDISQKDVDDLKEEILSGLINGLYDNWQMAVTNSSLNPNTKKIYSQTLDKFKTSRFVGGVGLTRGGNIWLANAIEEGIGAFDMKEKMLQSKKAKTGKLGQKYITIPFRIGTPTSDFQVIMSNTTYQIAKSLEGKQQIRQGQLKGKDAEKRIRPMIKTQTRIFNEYKHKSSVFAGIQKGQGKNQGQYHTLRRISNAPQPMGSDDNSWIHKGIQAYHLAEKAIAIWGDSGVDDLINGITQNFLNQKFG
jgi:hypothetical protein